MSNNVKPPLRMRFEPHPAPQRAEPWKGFRDATSPRYRCAQINPYTNNKFLGSQDCLHLNVYTPSLTNQKSKLAADDKEKNHNGDQKLPVMVFIHGGRYLYGAAASYKPEFLVEKDVILVTVSYRIHILGFLCLDIEEVPGNAGAKDIIMALQWIRENIHNFNGYKNNVTLFGESSGSCLASTLLFSPLNDGLIHKLINESGSILSDNFMVIEDEFDKAVKVCEALGSNAKTAKEIHNFLIKVEIEELVKAVVKVEQSLDHSIPKSLFQPVVEKFETNAFLNKNPKDSLHKGDLKKIPVIAGYNSHEGVVFVKIDDKGEAVTIEDFKKLLPLSLKIDKKSYKADVIAKEIENHYCVDDISIINYGKYMADDVIVRDTHRFIDELLRFNVPVYFYKYCYMGNLNVKYLEMLGLRGALHSDQLRYQFYNEKNNKKMDFDDRKIAEFFAEAWTNFAKIGVPKFKDAMVPKWPPVTKDKRTCLNIDKELSLVEFPDKECVLFWREIFRMVNEKKAKL